MPALLQRLKAASNELVGSRKSSGPPGNFSLGTGWVGGPQFTDAYQAKRAPTPWQLVETYKSLIYACVAKNASAVMKVPLRLYADESQGNGKIARSVCGAMPVLRGTYKRFLENPWMEYTRVAPRTVENIFEIRTHPVLSLLDRSDPYGYFNRKGFIALISAYCDVVGFSYVWPEVGGRNSVPRALWPLFSQYVLPIRLIGSPLVEKFQYFADQIPFDDIIRFKAHQPSLRDPYAAAFSPTYAAIEYARLEDAFVAIQEQLLGSGPRPNIIFSAKDPMQAPGEIERKRFQKDLNRELGAGNAGKGLVTNGSWDITPVSYSPTDLAGMEISKYDFERTCNCFGIPPTIMTTDSNLANIEAGRALHAQDAVEPRCHMIAATLTEYVRQFDERLFFAFDPAVAEDEERRANIDDKRLKNGSRTINQVNEDTSYPPAPYGDQPWLSGTLKQPDMLMEQHEQGLAAGDQMLEQGAMGADEADDMEEGEEGDGEAERAIGQAVLRAMKQLTRKAS